MVLTYEDYTQMGGAMDAAQFDRSIAQAESILNRMTHGRIRGETPARPCVQYAAHALAEAIQRDAQSGPDGREATSVSNDGVSITYASGAGSADALRAQRYAGLVRQYLEWETDANGTFLLYAGVDA